MHPTTLTLRRAEPADAAALDRLAELEEAAPLRGDVLLAERGGAVVAALSPADGRAVADIFLPTAGALKLLRDWAAEVRPPSSRAARGARGSRSSRPPRCADDPRHAHLRDRPVPGPRARHAHHSPAPRHLPPVVARGPLQRAVARQHDAGRERPRLDELEARHVRRVLEQPLPAAEDDRVDEQPVLVHQARRDQVAARA